MTRSSLVAVAFLASAFSSVPAGPVGAAAPGPDTNGLARVIVVLESAAGDPATVAREHQGRYGGAVRFFYHHALRGYAAEMPRTALERLGRERGVAYVERDQVLTAQGEVPTGVDRIEADKSPPARIDGTDERVDVDVAVLDTGIAPHPDLNLVGGVRCTGLLGLFASCSAEDFTDGNGHGTHVAGTAAALDNGLGVVGVAPGARLWGVKVLNDLGIGFNSEILAGIDWVTARAATIEVVNMSLGCECASQAMTDAINRSTDAGLLYSVAAGNGGKDASAINPANHSRVLAVSAMADFDGAAGGGAAATCRSETDDTFADFSNFGSVVDIAAPGVCITSTWKNGAYATSSGTSMASPHVAGAAALYIAAEHVGQQPQRWSIVRSAILNGWAVPQGDPCGFTGGRSGEPMLLLAPCYLASSQSPL